MDTGQTPASLPRAAENDLGQMAPEIRSDVHKHIPAEPKLTLGTPQDKAGLCSHTSYPVRLRGPVPPRGTCSVKGGTQLLLTPVQLWGDFSSLSPVTHIPCDLVTCKGGSRDTSDHPTKSHLLVIFLLRKHSGLEPSSFV